MKTFFAILFTGALALAQTPAPTPAPAKGISLTETGPRKFHRPAGSGFTSGKVIVNNQYTANLSSLADETGCTLQVFGGPPKGPLEGWNLNGTVFSGTPRGTGIYRLSIACTTPNLVKQTILLRVFAKAPPTPKPPTPSQSVKLN